MSRRYEIDVAAAVGLYIEHKLGQSLDCDGLTVAMMTDIKVLAEHAAKVAACKKYCPRAAGTYKGRFFAEVRPNGADQGFVGNAAKAGLAGAAMNFALARTNL